MTTAWLESLSEEMNDWVQGTEMFWTDPDGTEAILQVRAASLYSDERLIKHLGSRPGCPFTRRPRSPKLVRKKSKAVVQLAAIEGVPVEDGLPKGSRASWNQS